MFLIDKGKKKATSLIKKSFAELNVKEREDFQEWIVDNPHILGENLLIIQKEFDGFNDTNERLDLLALDELGRLVVIENKLDDSGKNVVWQSLKYVSFCATLTKTQICEIYQRYLGTNGVASEKISEFYDEQDYENIKLNHAGEDQRIILVAANFRREVTSTVLWLRDHGVDITCIKVTPYMDGEKLYLDAEQILPIQDVGDYQIRLTAKKQEESTTSKEEATRHKLRRQFWERALPAMREKSGIYHNVSPSADNWLYGASGHSGIVYNAVIRGDGARVELLIGTSNRDRNKEIFRKIKISGQHATIHGGNVLDWRELPEKKASCISLHYGGHGLNDTDNWDEVIAFIADGLGELRRELQPLLDNAMRE